MKTVMKKMFCLMLVAVLMVGVMPFQAFADDGEGEQLEPQSIPTSIIIAFSGFETTITLEYDGITPAKVTDTSGIAAEIKGKHINGWTYEGVTKHSVKDFEFTTSAVLAPSYFEQCPCGIFADDTATPHTNPDCSMTPITALTCETCAEIGHVSTACPYCPDCLTNSIKDSSHKGNHCIECHAKPDTHNAGCTLAPGYYNNCDKCGRTYIAADKHDCCDRCKELHATANCPYCTICWAKGDKVATHTTSAHCTTCNGINGHLSGYPCYTAPATGSANLYVWARLYTGDVKTGTVLLDTITGLSSNDLVYQVVTNNKGRIESKIPAGYGWTGHVYYEQDPKTLLEVRSNLTVGAEDDVVLNLYTDQKLVVARVHTGKTYAIDRTINIDGFKIGNTVTSNDVLKAVQKYYNVSTLKMYTPAEWEKVVSGKTGAVIPNYEVHAGDNIIDVYVTGSHKTTSGTTHKADSTNPKTGDEIFVPMTVLFASVSSLAVLYYLNKKRAI